ncbi:enoyl-CoA delta isomerase 3, peroxisomal [Andrena cerasifolii]|uniref:enoyl-CoA delta isomerase 3, peroxisomal n=1 Tax=Andrena cerasifolii TaxID=2819439 RepID=UPI0040383FF8
MDNEDQSNILCSVENGIQKIVLNRPKKKNALDDFMYKRILQILHDSVKDSSIYMVVLTGTGNYFCSGNDFVSRLSQDNLDLEDAVVNFKNFVDTLITFPKLLVAIINGPAIGLAVTILPLFDMVYASDMAFFQTPFTRLGLVAEACSTYTFPNIFGHSKAGDMLYMGYKMNAIEAKQYGLVSEVYKHESLDEVWTYLRKVSSLSLQSILAIKRLVRRWNQNILLDVNAQESAEILKCMQSQDFLERILSIMANKSKM